MKAGYADATICHIDPESGKNRMFIGDDEGGDPAGEAQTGNQGWRMTVIQSCSTGNCDIAVSIPLSKFNSENK